MSKVNLLQGEACHLEFLRMEEGESKRHRARCIYFNKKNEYCSAFCGKCRGSSHCDKYSERLVIEKSHDSKRILDSELKAFSGIKVIPMSDIVIHKNFDIPTRKKLQEQIDYYIEHHSTKQADIIINNAIERGENVDEPIWEGTYCMGKVSFRHVTQIQELHRLWDQMCIISDMYETDYREAYLPTYYWSVVNK